MTATTTATTRPKQTKGRGPVQLHAAGTPSATGAGNEFARTTTESATPATAAASRKRPLPEAVARSAAGDYRLWFDTRGIAAPGDRDGILERVRNLGYTGVVLYADNYATLAPALGQGLEQIIELTACAELDQLRDFPSSLVSTGLAVASSDPTVLAAAASRGLLTCFRMQIDDAADLHAAIDEGRRHDYLCVRFRDPTNIPLELVIATLQSTKTVLIKEIFDARDVDDAVVSLGVMEVGADGVLYTPPDHATLDTFARRLRARLSPKVAIEVATVVRSVPIGMGTRSCLDLTTIFAPTEGLLVGSTSQGGILCCPEVFFLPYMELRPFRVNAGAVHSYVYNMHDRTDYMTELRAGSPVMIVNADGSVRSGAIGRVKTEVRPLRLIEAEFEGGERINVIMQDDWHVRIFSAAAEPRNITELAPGDKILAHRARPGRHVGIAVEERIVEQ